MPKSNQFNITPLHRAGIFFLSAAAMIAELILVRVLSITLWVYLAWIVGAFALSIMSVSGKFISLHKNRFLRNPQKFPALFAAVFAAAFPLSLRLMAQVPLDTFALITPAGFSFIQIGLLMCMIFLAAVPFSAAGLVPAAFITLAPKQSFRIVTTFLTGSAAGVLMYFFAYAVPGAENSIRNAAITALISSGLFLSGGVARRAPRLIWAIIPALIPVIWFLSPDIPDIHAAPSQSITQFIKTHPGFEMLDSIPEPTVRIDVIGSDINMLPNAARDTSRFPQISIFRDGGDPIVMTHYGMEPEDICGYAHRPEAAPFHVGKASNVLILGAEGGETVRAALHFHASRIAVVFPDTRIVDLLTCEYTDFVDNIFYRPGVSVFQADPRQFLRTTREKFDIIHFAPLHPGRTLPLPGFFPNNRCYTVEAMRDALMALKTNGILEYTGRLARPPRKMLRIVSTGLESLKTSSASEPENHIIVMENKGSCSVMIKKSPWTVKEIATYTWFAKTHPEFRMLYTPGTQVRNAFTDFIKAVKNNSREVFYDTFPFNIHPVSDDAPFFFDDFTWRRFPDQAFASGERAAVDENQAVLKTAGLMLSVQSLLFLLFCVFYRRPENLSGPLREKNTYRYETALIFSGIGQALVLYALLNIQGLFPGLWAGSAQFAILPGFLFSAALGSLFAEKWNPGLSNILLITTGLVAVYALFLPALFQHSAHSGYLLQLLIGPAIVFFPGFLSGMPLPVALNPVSPENTRLSPAVPRLWSIYPAAAIFGLAVSVLIAESPGFTGMLFIAAGMFLLSWISARYLDLAFWNMLDYGYGSSSIKSTSKKK